MRPPLPWRLYRLTEIPTIGTLPLVFERVTAGFPSPADDYIELKIDLNKELIEEPSSTFMVRVDGNSMEGADIRHNSLLIVHKTAKAKPGDVIVAYLNGEFTVKRLVKHKGRMCLKPEHPAYDPIVIREDMDFRVWGVVKWVILEP